MEKSEIERRVSERILRAVEAAAAECIDELNAEGHSFAPDDDSIFEWIDGDSNRVLAIHCGLGVSVESRDESVRPPDPDLQEYLRLAESGGDRAASVINQLEGDVANGGFLQLLHNKGPVFIREAIEHLEEVGAPTTAAVVREALGLITSNESLVTAYDDLEIRIGGLDSRFFELGENLPRLVVQRSRRDLP